MFLQVTPYNKSLLAAYEQAGRPRFIKKWLAPIIERDFRWIARRPRWTGGEGNWPFLGDRPMFFVGQFMPAKNKVPSEYFSGGDMWYVFIGENAEGSEIKLYHQSVGEQTAEDHYRAEDMMGEYARNPHNPAVVSKCVKEGDRYVHEFLLEQRNLSPLALELLASKGRNKEIRDAAAKRRNAK